MRPDTNSVIVDPEPEVQRTKRPFWRIGGLALFALLVLIYAWNIYLCSRFEPTGDALLDRYAKAAISRSAWKLFHSWGRHPASLPPKLVESWEGEFGDDPRYWRLKAWNAAAQFKLREYTDQDAYSDAQQAAITVLEGAQAKGRADGENFALLFKLKLEQAAGEDEAANRAALYGMLDEVRVLAPDLAWPDYFEASMQIKVGRFAQASTMFKSAEAKADKHLPALSPVDMIETEETEHPVNPFLMGAIADCEMGPFMIPMLYRDKTMEFARWLAAEGDTQGQTALHRFGCWLAGQRFGLHGMRIIREQAYARLLEDDGELLPEQKLLLLALINRQQHLATRLAGYGSFMGEVEELLLWYNWVSTPKFYVYYTSLPQELQPGFALARKLYAINPGLKYRYLWQKDRLTSSHFTGHTLPQLSNMALIDYSTLELPKQWEDIEAESDFPQYGAQTMPEHIMSMQAEMTNGE